MACHGLGYEVLKGNGCAMDGAAEIAEGLRRMCFEFKARSLVRFEDLCKAMIEWETASLRVIATIRVMT